MTLQSFVGSLPIEKQYQVALKLCKLALPIWDKYAVANELFYVDTVVGMAHTVDKQILIQTIEAVESYLSPGSPDGNDAKKAKLITTSELFDDPIVSLQDEDWKLPNDVLTTFYSVYNLIYSLIDKQTSSSGESRIYLSINQSVDSLVTAKLFTFDEINIMLSDGNKN